MAIDNLVATLVNFIEEMIKKYMSTLRLAMVNSFSKGDDTCRFPYVNVSYLDGKNEQGNVMFIQRTGARTPKKGDIVIVGFRPENNPFVLGFLEVDTELFNNLSEGDTVIKFSEDSHIQYQSEIDQVNVKATKEKIEGDLEVTGDLKVSGGTKGVARVGDSVSVVVPDHGTCVGTITSGSSEVKID